MRSLACIFGLTAGSVTVALVARYGFLIAGSDADGMILAFLFGVVAAGGLGGHAIAVAVWRHNWMWGFVFGLVCAAALTVNLSNSLGAIAGRSDSTQAERVKLRDAARDARSEMERLLAERSKMPAFIPADDVTVDVAHATVAGAEAIRQRECGNGDPRQRGMHCRQRETDEQAARAALGAAISNRSLTTQAARLDGAIEAARERLAQSKTVGSENPQAKALAHLFKVSVDDAATWQQLAMATIVELLIVCSLVAFEIMRPARATGQAAALPVPPPLDTLDPVDFLAECLRPAPRGRVGRDALYAAYATKSAGRGMAPAPADAFFAVVDQLGAPQVIEGDKTYITRVRLAA